MANTNDNFQLDGHDEEIRRVYEEAAITTQRMRDELSKILLNTSMGDPQSIMGNDYYGFNHRVTRSMVPINKDQYGLTFFTRPLLNLTDDNLVTARELVPMMTNVDASIPRFTRTTLDPRIQRYGVSSPFVDNRHAFIPLLTNNLISLSGFPDPEVETFVSKPGRVRESWMMADGTHKIYYSYDITANFRNLLGDPISALLYSWIVYMSKVFIGDMVPYPEYIINNMIDYQTRIYRLVLDPTKRFVTKIGCTGASFPVTVPVGASMNYDVETPINSSNEQLRIIFKSVGAVYNDHIVMNWFNKAGEMTNPELADGKREQRYRKIPIDALMAFNHRGFPRINLETTELEWWVDEASYAERWPIYESGSYQQDDVINDFF